MLAASVGGRDIEKLVKLQNFTSCPILHVSRLYPVLADPVWMKRMTAVDLRGLTPLIWGHVNPYGTFKLDMNERLELDVA